jgi:adenylate cyclase
VEDTRRLAVIMFTDMVGSTAAAQADEAGALTLRDEQAALLRASFAAHRGRTIKSLGDGFLAEFDSALHAVTCALEIQDRLRDRNQRPNVRPILVRIGIHVGDVEQREEDIFGDAVNVASRIEAEAPSGGVCISGEVYALVRNRLPDRFEKLAPRLLKGVSAPIDLYQAVPTSIVQTSASTERDGPGIAVLPFSNISPDPQDSYFADGLTEELITVLAQLPGLRVIARTSVMQFKSTTKAVSQIGAELGVGSVLEGSVRKSGNRLRITAQLVDARTQGHVWANTYDRELDDVFAVQANIAKEVAEALRPQLQPGEGSRLRARPPVRPDSYLAYLKGRTLLHGTDPKRMEEARRQFELAISLDPSNAAAHSGRSDAIRLAGWFSWKDSRARWKDADASAHRAIELDPELAEAHASLGIILWDEYDFSGGEKELRRAVALNPSYSQAHLWLGSLIEDMGRPDAALPEYRLAEASDPLWTFGIRLLARSLRWTGHLEEALETQLRLLRLEPTEPWPHSDLAEYYFQSSQLERCLDEIRTAMKLEPHPGRQRELLARHHAYAGQTERARDLLKDLESSFDGSTPGWRIAQDYARIGSLDDCFRMLRQLVEIHQLPMQDLRNEPALENVRKDPRFREILERQNLA